MTILPVVTKDPPISPRFTPYDFLSRCNFSTLTTRQPMVEFDCKHQFPNMGAIRLGFLLATTCVWVWMVRSLHSVTTGSRDRANVSLIIIIIIILTKNVKSWPVLQQP